MKLRAFFLAVAALVVVSLFWSAPSQAEAATAIAPDAPRPINVLPSTAAAIRSTGIAAPAASQAWVYYLYNAAKTPEFWQAVNAQKAGTATAGQLALVQEGADDFKVPATKAAKLLKVAGGVGVAVTGLEVGGMMGNGALELFGFDVDGTVCPNTGTDPIGLAAQWFSNTDCDAWKPTGDFVPNTDATAKPAGYRSHLYARVDNAMAIAYGAPTVTGAQITVPASVTSWNVGYGFNSEAHYLWCKPSGGSPFLATGRDLRHANNTQAWSATELSANRRTATGNWFCANNAAPYAFGYGINTWTTADSLPTCVSGLTQCVVWYSSASPNYQPAETADPDRRLICEVEASNGQTYSGQTDVFRESSMKFPAPVCPVLPPEVYPERITVDEVGGPTPAELYNEPTTPEYQEFQQTFPDCDSGTCMLDLLKNNTSCFQTPAACVDWFSDPNKSSTYSCTYGSVPVDLAECNVYAPSFTSDPSAGTQYGDPTTGAPLPSTVPNTRDAQYSNGSVSDPETTRQCMPTGWGVLNPIEWVLRPVQCALEWAFVPRQSALQAQYDRIVPLYLDTMPGELNAAVASWEFAPPPTHCNGITLDMSWIPGQSSIQMLNACPGDPLEPFAGWAKFFFYVAFTVVGTLGSIRNAASTVGYRGLGGDS